MKYPPKCNQGDSATINGVYCHEHGCPNREKFWDEENKMWMDYPDEDENDFPDWDDMYPNWEEEEN